MIVSAAERVCGYFAVITRLLVVSITAALLILGPVLRSEVVGASAIRATASMEGVILNAATEEPLVGVRLLIAPGGQSAFTDAKGRFVFENIAAGAIVLSGQKSGYMNLRQANLKLPGNHGIPLLIKETDRLNWTLRLWPAPTVTGRIFDDTGRPVQSIRIVPYRMVYDEKGALVPKFFRAVMTNDVGEYRFDALDAGEYRFYFEPPVEFGRARHASLYYPTYYPIAADSKEGESVMLESGRETRLRDVILRSARGGTFGLTLAGAPEMGPRTLIVRRRGATSLSETILKSFQTNSAEIGPLAPGLYDFEVIVQEETGSLSTGGSFQVEDRDVAISVSVERTVRVKGSVSTVATAIDAPGPVKGVELRFISWRMNAPRIVSQEDGSLRSSLPTGIGPGTYSVHVENVPSEFYVASIRAGSQDLTRENLIVRDSELSIEVLLDVAVKLHGTVKDSDGLPVAGDLGKSRRNCDGYGAEWPG